MTKVFVVHGAEISSIDHLSISSTTNQVDAENAVAKYRETSQDMINGCDNEIEISDQKLDTIDLEDEKPCKRKNSKVKIPTNNEDGSTFRKRSEIFTVPDYPITGNTDAQQSSMFSLESEKQISEKRGQRRNSIFKSIILDEEANFFWIELSLNSIGIIIIDLLITFPLTLIPFHDLVKFPDYWYEIIVAASLVGIVGIATRCILFGSYMNLEYLLRPLSVALFSLAGFGIPPFLIILSYYAWTSVWNYRFPIPLLGLASSSFLFVCNIILVWLLLPKNWRKNRNLKKRMGNAALELLTQIFCNFGYNIITQLIAKSSIYYQPVVALALPALREFNSFITTKLVIKAANGDAHGSTMILNYFISAQYAIILCIVLGSLATSTTSWLLLGLDYTYNIWLCLKIVWLKSRHPLMIEKQIAVLQELAMCELVEILAPSAFILVFITASYGPNYRLFGNIGNSYWTYVAIEDINQALRNMTQVFLVDLSSAVVTGLILRFSCKINLLKSFNELLKEFRTRFGFILGYFLILVSMNFYNWTACHLFSLYF